MKRHAAWGLTALLYMSATAAAPQDLLDRYAALGAGPFDAAAGESAWRTQHRADDQPRQRSCADCHGTDLTRAGKHLKTGKVIEPLAVSVNAKRLSDPKQVEKWLRRNCKFTLGRICTAAEKGNFIKFIASQ